MTTMGDPNYDQRLLESATRRIVELEVRLTEVEAERDLAVTEAKRWCNKANDHWKAQEAAEARAERTERDLLAIKAQGVRTSEGALEVLRESVYRRATEEIRQWILARGPVVDEALKHDDAHDLLATAIWAGAHRPKGSPRPHVPDMARWREGVQLAVETMSACRSVYGDDLPGHHSKTAYRVCCELLGGSPGSTEPGELAEHPLGECAEDGCKGASWLRISDRWLCPRHARAATEGP